MHCIPPSLSEQKYNTFPHFRVNVACFAALLDMPQTQHCMTAIYRDLTEGTYYPAASLYTLPEQTEGATVTFNFGKHDGSGTIVCAEV